MRIVERRVADAAVLELSGPIVGRKSGAIIVATVRRHTDAGTRVVVADLGNVPSVDLEGLGSLLDALRAMRAAGGELRLARVAVRIHDLVVLTRLVTVFDAFDSVEDAVGLDVVGTAAPPAAVCADPCVASAYAAALPRGAAARR